MKIPSFRHLRRKANLERLINEFGGASALGILVGTPKSHISALMAGTRGIGDKLALKLEKKCDKPAGWMDDLHDGELLRHPNGLVVLTRETENGGLSGFGIRPSREDMELLSDLHELLPEDRARFLAEIHAQAEQMRKHAEMVLKRAGVKATSDALTTPVLPDVPEDVAHKEGENPNERGKSQRAG